MQNVYSYDDNGVLQVSQHETKTLDDVKRVVAAGKPLHVIDKFIELHLFSLDPNHAIADEWHELNQELETLDPNQESETKTTVDDEGNETVETLPTEYEVCAAKIKQFEIDNPWLLDFDQRPEWVIDVEQFKADNSVVFSEYLKNQGAEIDNKAISLTEENQNGIAAVMQGIGLAKEFGQDIFPINFKARTKDGSEYFTFSKESDFKVFALKFMAERQKFFA